MRPSEQMAYLNDLEYAKKHRGALVDALVLPDHDLNRITCVPAPPWSGASLSGDVTHRYPGHAPAGPFGDFGPLAPSKGTRNGDVLGATHSVRHRNCTPCCSLGSPPHRVVPTYSDHSRPSLSLTAMALCMHMHTP